MKDKPAKRVNIVRVKVELVKESSILYPKRSISSPADAAELIRPFLADMDREAFIVLCLDTKNKPTSIQNAIPSAINVASVGSLNSSIVSCREIFKVSILSQSASVILFHNHPSGDILPSREDQEVTKRLIEAGSILGIEVLDHIIIGNAEDKSYYSFKEEGMM